MRIVKRIIVAAGAVALAVGLVAVPGMYHHSHPTARPVAMHYHGHPNG